MSKKPTEYTGWLGDISDGSLWKRLAVARINPETIAKLKEGLLALARLKDPVKGEFHVKYFPMVDLGYNFRIENGKELARWLTEEQQRLGVEWQLVSATATEESNDSLAGRYVVLTVWRRQGLL